MIKLFGFLILFLNYSQALIVPQELPSILSLVYSNIPPIKKGTDSRIGFGFRLGEHADFQVMLELGPQTETRPIGGNSAASTSKRNVKPSDFNSASPKKPLNEEASSWLSGWSNHMHKTTTKQKLQQSRVKGSNDIRPSMNIQTVPLISESALNQLQQLYRLQQNSEKDTNQKYLLTNQQEISISTTTQRSPEKNKQITAELMDVDLED